MISRLLLLAAVASAELPKVYRRDGHFFGPNMTVPKTMSVIGTVNVQGHGSVNVISNSPNNIYMVDNGFVLHGGGRAYLATGGDIGDPYTYWAADISNKHFAYSIDVSQVSCKCNAAMYWVNMPGMDEGNNPVPGPGGDYYCDANFVNQNWCPEYDTYEGNAETTNVALHTCDYVPPNDYPSCDKGGCGTNACTGIPGQYCRGCTIDTNRFHYISHSQIYNGEEMVKSNHFYEQDGKSATYDACGDANYVKNMGYSLHGTVPVFSLWDMGCDETWLDGCTGCGGCCDLGGAQVTFTNFQLESAKYAPNPEVRQLYAKYHPEDN